MSYIENLAIRLMQRSDELEESHFDAAMDAEISVVDRGRSNSKPILPNTKNEEGKTNSDNNDKHKNSLGEYKEDDVEHAIFDDYSNPNAVHNCLSPYVPAKADRIKAFIEEANLKEGESSFDGDTILDIGCGDGRVCIASAKMSGNFFEA